MTEIKNEPKSPEGLSMLYELEGGYTFAHGRKGKAEEGEATLAPCPFCGSTNPVASMYGENSLFKVECKNCGALVRGFDQCRQDAIDAWNTRASPAPDPVRTDLADECRNAAVNLSPSGEYWVAQLLTRVSAALRADSEK